MVPQVFNEKACVICNEAITNPLCVDCLEEEMTSWIADFDSDQVKNIEEMKEIFPKHKTTEVKCILCKRNMDVCPHCYSKEILNTVKTPILTNTFIETFNFDLR